MLLVANVMSEFEEIQSKYTKILYLYSSIKNGEENKVENLLNEIKELKEELQDFMLNADPLVEQDFEPLYREAQMMLDQVTKIEQEFINKEDTNEETVVEGVTSEQEEALEDLEELEETTKLELENEIEDEADTYESERELNKDDEEVLNDISTTEDYNIDSEQLSEYNDETITINKENSIESVFDSVTTYEDLEEKMDDIVNSNHPLNIKIALLYSLLGAIYKNKLYDDRKVKLLESKIINTILKFKISLFEN